MLFVQWHIGDWVRETHLLSPLERGIYMDLLVEYYDSETPLMRSQCERIARAYADEEREAMRFVLEKFFVLQGDCYHHTRCDEEISRYKDKQAKAKKSAEARWNKAPGEKCGRREHANGMQTECECNANASETHVQKQCDCNANQEPITNNQTLSNESDIAREPRAPRTPARTVPCPDDVNPEAWDTWLQIRRDKKQRSLTAYALSRMRAEADKCGLTLQEAIDFCVMRGWAGFTKTYYDNAMASLGGRPPERKSSVDWAAVADGTWLEKYGRDPDLDDSANEEVPQ